MCINYAHMGERIKKRRRSLDFTQDYVAEAAGLTNNYISNIENNRSIPSIDSLMKICTVLDTTPDYFLLGVLRHSDNERTAEIMDKMKLCDERKLRLISNFVTWIIEEEI